MENKKLKLFVPGRLCLFGEHSDWAGGYRKLDKSIIPGHCIAIGTDQGIHAEVSVNTDEFIIISKNINGEIIGKQSMKMQEDELLKIAESGGFFSYAAGVAYYILKDYNVKGLLIDNMIDLPIRRGLSSSAAICVLTARAFSEVYGLGLTHLQEMDYAYKGEILTGSECGRMDQVCAYGGTPVFLTFDGDDMEVEELFPCQNVYMVIADLRSGKNTRKILFDLNHHFMNKNSSLKEKLRYALGKANKEILFQAKDSLIKGNSPELGRLMKKAQQIFDEFVIPACPEELTAPLLHKILSHPDIQEFVYGGKGVGSQGDGCVQFVAKGQEEQKELVKMLTNLGVQPYELTIKARIDKHK